MNLMVRMLCVLACLIPVKAAGQATQSFPSYVNSLPAVTSVGPTDKLYLLQGGVSKSVSGSVLQQNTSYLSVMDFCTAAQVATDIAACAQAAITAAAANATTSSGARLVFFPAPFSPYNLLGTLTLPSFVGLLGEGIQTTYINCANGSSDCVQIGQASGSQTRDQSITNLSIFGNGSKTAGAAVHIQNAFRVLLQNVSFESQCRGVDVDTKNNSVTIQNATITVNQACSDFGIYWHDATTGATRSDVLTLDNVVIDGSVTSNTFSGATGIEWDGFTNTMVASHLRVLHLTKGMCTNCVASGASFPSFFNGFDVEMEGFLSLALDMNTGTFQEFKCGECDFNNLTGFAGSADTNVIKIGSGVTGFQLTNSRVGDSQQTGIVLGGKNVQLSNIQFFATSVAGSASFPVIDVLGTAVGTQIHNIVCGEQGGANNLSSFCVQFESGSLGNQVSNIDASNVVSGAINDAGGNSRTTFLPAIREPTGFTSTALGQWKDNFQGEMRNLISNGATGANVKTSHQLSTATANSFSLLTLADGAGSPSLTLNTGSGVSGGITVDASAASGAKTTLKSASALPVVLTPFLQTGVTTVASLPACTAGLQGSHYFVTDQATAVAYHGAVTGSGASKQGVTCDGSAWYQD